MEKIYTPIAPEPIGPYSQAMKTPHFMITSGQIAINPMTKALVEGGIKEQTEQVCKNLAVILSSSGVGLEKVLKTTCYLKNMDDFDVFNEVYAKYFTSKPARSCVEVSRLPKDALIEIEVIAEVPIKNQITQHITPALQS